MDGGVGTVSNINRSMKEDSQLHKNSAVAPFATTLQPSPRTSPCVLD